MKRKLFTLLTLLLTVCSGAWGGDYVDTYSNFGAVTGDYVGTGISKIALGEGATASSGIKASSNGTDLKFTVSTPTGFTLKSVAFNGDSNTSSVTCSDSPETTLSGTITGTNTYTASSAISSVTFTVGSKSGKATKLTNFVVTVTSDSDDDYELITPTSISSGTISYTSSLGEGKMVTAMAGLGGPSVGTSGIEFGNSKGFSLTTSRAIKAVYCIWYQRGPALDSGWTGYNSADTQDNTTKIGTYTTATNAWVASDSKTKYVCFKRSEGSTAKICKIHVFYYDDLPSYDMIATVDNAEHGTSTVSSASVIQGDEVTFTAFANVGWKFTKWTDTTTGDDVSTENPYTISSVTGAVGLTANFEAETTYNVTISAGATGALGSYYDNTIITQNQNTTVTLPAKNSWFYKEGYTATGWTDGTNDYEFGGSFTLTGDVTIYPKFRENTKALGDADATVVVNLGNSSIGKVHIENTKGYLVTTAVVDGETIDVPLYWDNTSGKLDNRTRESDAQINNGSTFTIPAVKGMTVTLACNYAITATLDGEAMDATDAAPFTATGQYTGSAKEVQVVINGGSWFTSIAIDYKVNYTKPTIVADTYSFENGGYPVMITASEGDLYVSTDGETYTVQTSPYETTVTNGSTIYAKATGDIYAASEVATYTNTFDPAKSTVAWVYESNYSGYSYDADPMADAIDDEYNVVKVNAYSTDMGNADLIIVTEALDGKGSFMKSMKIFVGTTPMINLKFFAYTKGDGNNNRWNWGAPTNNTGYYTITPTSVLYKVLNGVTYELDGSVKMFNDSPSGNVIQTVVWDAEPTAFPASNVDMGTTNSKVSMHSSDKFFGLGLSCDNKANYSTNAITIVKNAAAMLIAGEDLTSKFPIPTVTLNANGFATYSAVHDFTVTGATAYKMALDLNEGKLVGTAIDTAIPAGEGVMLKGEAGATVSIVEATGAPELTGNSLKGTTKKDGTTATVGSNKYYVLSGDTFKPYAASEFAANKAYFEVDGEAPARAFIMTFDEEGGETTGIAAVKSEEMNAKGIYTLSGQRVVQPAKGLYIINGKKVILK